MALSLKEILSPIENHLSKVDIEIKESLTTGINLLDESAYHLFKSGGGKKIRASLVILSSGLGGKIPDSVIPIAAAVEVVHAATLVHDDIIDQAYLRRGDITVSKKWGNKIAVLAGDYMYTMGLDAAVDEDDPRAFPVMVAGTRAMVKGEFYQLEYSDIKSITVKEYFRIIEHKTAIFMATCTKLGAIKANLQDSDLERMYQFGYNLGMAFQIVDDTLDFIESKSVTGKDEGNDFLDGKVTIPFLHLLENSSEKDKLNYIEIISDPEISRWDELKDAIQKSGSIDYSLKLSHGYIEKSLDLIDKFPQSEEKEILIKIAEFIGNRNY